MSGWDLPPDVETKIASSTFSDEEKDLARRAYVVRMQARRRDFERLRTLSPSAQEDLASTIRKTAYQIPDSQRLASKFKVGEGAKSYLVEKHGGDNVIPLSGNDFAVWNPEKMRTEFAENAGNTGTLNEFSQDITDLSGEMLEGGIAAGSDTLTVPLATAGGALAGGAVAGPPGAIVGGVLGASGAMAGGGALARATRQLFSSALPGEDFPDATSRAKDVALSAGMSALAGPVSQGVGALGRGIMRRLPGVDKVEKTLGRSGVAPKTVAAEKELLKETPYPQNVAEMAYGTPAEEKAIQSVSEMSAARPKAAALAAGRQVEEATKSLDAIINKIGAGKLSGEEAALETAMKKPAAIKAIRDDLSTNGSAKFDAFRAAAEDSRNFTSPGRPKMPTEFGAPGALKQFSSPRAASILDKEISITPKTASPRLVEIRDKFLSPSTGEDFLRLRRKISRAAAGEEILDRDLSEDANKRLGAQLLSAITEDLDAFGARLGGEPQRLLQEANAYWAAGEEAIKAHKATQLAIAIKSAAKVKDIEQLTAEDFLRGDKLTQAMWSKSLTDKQVLHIQDEVRRLAPEESKDFTRQIVSDMLSDVKKSSVSRAGVATGEKQIDFVALAEKLAAAQTKSRLQAVMGNGPEFNALVSLADDARKTSLVKNLVDEEAVRQGWASYVTPVSGGAVGAALGAGGGPAAATGLAVGGAAVAKKLPTWRLRIRNPKVAIQAIFDPKTAVMINAALRPSAKTSPKYIDKLNAQILSRLSTFAVSSMTDEEAAQMKEDVSSGARKALQSGKTLGSAVYNYLSGGIEEE